ncbi:MULTISPECIES: hypothetical protein [Flagellimonas]|uniref:Uncharacterized protein n=2 Tax=Flagellimonas TaxID=444459 RepID=A0ABT5XRS9_9FLAO|nr:MULTISPECIES: hypothetical protein [Allomuricauda]MBO0356172.1 hypothetical protein [Allomuricauda aurea]MDF0708579.1 hypothetical protein [[Muricauda] okinawensis]
MKKVDFQEYKANLISLGIPEEEIYDFTGDVIESFYQRYFDWCVDNIIEYSPIFGVEPAYFYFWDTYRINAVAGKGKSAYRIRFSKPYMEALYGKLGRKGQFFDKTDWVAFKNLQNITPNSLEFLMFQASTIFTFYHEFAHLVQYKDKVFSMNEHSTDDTYSYEKHVFEYDADLNGCQFVSVYFQQFFQEQIPEPYQTDNNYKRLMYLGISSILITQLLFLYGKIYPFQPENLDTDFYTREKSHPHTLVRAKYIIEHYVNVAKANGVKIDFGDTTRNVTIICNEFFKDSGLFKNFIEGFQNHFDEINAYALDLYIGQRNNSNCIKHKIKLFGFNSEG